MKKILLVSEFTPPVLEGIAIMLYNIFRFFPPDSVCMFTDDPAKRLEKKDESIRLPFKHYIFRVPNFSFWFIRPANIRVFLQYCWLPFILLYGIKLIISEKIKIVFAINTRGPYLVAAYYLHKITRTPFYVYMFDLWSEVLTNSFQRWVAQKYEKRILQSAKKIFVMSEGLADYYKEKYSVESEVIYHSYISNHTERTVEKDVDTKGKDFFDIVFTGIVELDCTWLQLVREILNDLSKERIRLKLCVPRIDYVREINDENIIVRSLSRNEAISAQKKADILFLPMYLKENCNKDVLKTASPSKLGEYLFSGVPILVFAPKYSYISEYATKEKWALVVNSFDKEKLKSTILRLKNDSTLRKELVSNALKVVINHNAQLQSSKIQNYLFA